MKYFLNLILLLLLFVPCAAQHFRLSLNLTKGNTYYMVGNSKSIILQMINGKENKVELGLLYTIAFKVTSVMDSLYSMEVRYQALNMKINIADKTIVLDSRKNDKQDISSTIIAAMMNKPFTIIMAKNGKIKSIKNIEEMIRGVFDNFPQVDAAKKAQIESRLLQSLGGNAFKGNLEMETAIFPEVKVTKNDKWTVNAKLESTFKANVHTVYHLTGTEGGSYKINGDGTIVTDKNSKSSQINGLPMKYKITGTSTSTIKADKITGWISEVKLRQVMKGYVEILDNPKVPGGLKIPMTFINEVTTTDK